MSGLFERSIARVNENLSKFTTKFGQHLSIFIDNREDAVISQMKNLPFVKIKQLKYGDVQIFDEKKNICLIVFERKRCDDLQSARKTGKFEKQRQQLKHWEEPLFKWYINETPCWMENNALVKKTLARHRNAFQIEQSTAVSTVLKHRLNWFQTRNTLHTCHFLIDVFRVFLTIYNPQEHFFKSTHGSALVKKSDAPNNKSVVLSKSKEKSYFARKSSQKITNKDDALTDKVAAFSVLSGISASVSHSVVVHYPNIAAMCTEAAQNESGFLKKLSLIEVNSERKGIQIVKKKRKVGKANAKKILDFLTT